MRFPKSALRSFEKTIELYPRSSASNVAMNVKVETDGYAPDNPNHDLVKLINGSRRRLTIIVFAPTSVAICLCAGVGAKEKKSNGVFDAFNISAESIESLPAPFKRSVRTGRSNRVGVGTIAEGSYGKAIRLWKSIFIS